MSVSKIAGTSGCATVIDGVVRAAGRVPEIAEIKGWLTQTRTELPITNSTGFSSSEPQSCCCGETVPVGEEATCCGPPPPTKDWSGETVDASWITGKVDTPAGPVPRVSTTVKWTDRLGSWKARWGMGRMQYWVKPRLYAAGAPTSDSPVFVSANYKMSFDRLRAALGEVDGWILVLDTEGVSYLNVRARC